MKKLSFNKIVNFTIVLFVWACMHFLNYRFCAYMSPNLEVPQVIMLWLIAIVAHFGTCIMMFREMLWIYVGKYSGRRQ